MSIRDMNEVLKRGNGYTRWTRKEGRIINLVLQVETED